MMWHWSRDSWNNCQCTCWNCGWKYASLLRLQFHTPSVREHSPKVVKQHTIFCKITRNVCYRIKSIQHENLIKHFKQLILPLLTLPVYSSLFISMQLVTWLSGKVNYNYENQEHSLITYWTTFVIYARKRTVTIAEFKSTIKETKVS